MGCDRSESYRLANCFTKYRVKSFAKGELIFQKGNVVRELSILAQGSFDVTIVLDSKPLSTKHWCAPYPMGVVALFSTHNYYRVDVVASEECKVIYVHVDEVEEQMMKCKRFLRNFIAHNIDKFDTITDHINHLSHKSLSAKLAYYILKRSDSNWEFRFDKKIGDLAEYLCVERPSLSRSISGLVKQGVITYDKGVGRVLNIDALKSIL